MWTAVDLITGQCAVKRAQMFDCKQNNDLHYRRASSPPRTSQSHAESSLPDSTRRTSLCSGASCSHHNRPYCKTDGLYPAKIRYSGKYFGQKSKLCHYFLALMSFQTCMLNNKIKIVCYWFWFGAFTVCFFVISDITTLYRHWARVAIG